GPAADAGGERGGARARHRPAQRLHPAALRRLPLAEHARARAALGHLPRGARRLLLRQLRRRPRRALLGGGEGVARRRHSVSLVQQVGPRRRCSRRPWWPRALRPALWTARPARRPCQARLAVEIVTAGGSVGAAGGEIMTADVPSGGVGFVRALL